MAARNRPGLRRLGGLLIAAGLVVGAGAVTGMAPAQAFGQAAFPTVSKGNRGVDVQAAQYLLQQRGYAIGTDGAFGGETDTAVRSFQRNAGLQVDGSLGPATWAALVPNLQDGAKGPAVRALQVQLNKKRRLALSVDGDFGSGTRAAVVAFQQHAGIDADGKVGPTTWRNLLWHFAYPPLTSFCDQDPDGNGSANWGTGSAIGQIEKAAATFVGTGQGRVPLGDVSFEHGGDIPGHASHEKGVDVDIWPIRTDSAQCTAGRITWQSAAYDRAATRQLIQAVRAAAAGQIAVIYFNDPQLIAEGLTVRYDNHDNHIHVRYS